ncbi:MAG: hypothetical protein QOI47_513, partial [Actinomycetota bacterium]|nr:hypothetical protein [Actinomycetota bacterium]
MSPDADAALRALGDELRAIGYDNDGTSALARFALGHSVPLDDVPGGLGAALVDAGVAEEADAGVRLRFAVLAIDGALSAIPTEGQREDLVYLGADSVLLLEHARAAATGGGARAADLGTGTGVVAACLAGDYAHVVATDLLLRATAATRQTVALNR